ncbi:hypothetical protein [Arthrobacter woluwensis]|uniref:hypothetical protein n=1 Tax=Arthrobacter woluwensis TaxID=156980 RepID=UPI0038067F74
MTTQQLNPVRPTGWLRLVYLILVVALFATAITVWFQTPQVRVESATANAGPTLVRCANAGSSRWDSPTVRPGRELVGGVGAQTTNLSILKNDLESLRTRQISGTRLRRVHSWHNSHRVWAVIRGPAIRIDDASGPAGRGEAMERHTWWPWLVPTLTSHSRSLGADFNFAALLECAEFPVVPGRGTLYHQLSYRLGVPTEAELRERVEAVLVGVRARSAHG